MWRWTDTPPDIPFSIAIATLAILTATLAAIPPALIATYRDPVRILRVPWASTRAIVDSRWVGKLNPEPFIVYGTPERST